MAEAGADDEVADTADVTEAGREYAWPLSADEESELAAVAAESLSDSESDDISDEPSLSGADVTAIPVTAAAELSEAIRFDELLVGSIFRVRVGNSACRHLKPSKTCVH